MRKPRVVRKIEKDMAQLSAEDLLVLLDGIVERLKRSMETQTPHNWEKLYGAGKGLWKEDAQEYVNRLREDR